MSFSSWTKAQSLGADLLEELRLLSNMNDGSTLKLQIILSGQPDLYTLLKRIDMTQFAQRIVVDYHLKPLSEVETANFIRHRIQVAGPTPRRLYGQGLCTHPSIEPREPHD